MSIGVALIGSGIFAKEAHLPAILSLRDTFKLKAVYSRSLRSAKGLISELENIDLYSDDSGEGLRYRDLLLCSEIEAVIVILPIIVQPDYIQQAIAAGKHVLAEKPIAKDVKTAESLLQWYTNFNVKVTFGIAENFRFLDTFRYAAEQSKQMGRLLGFRIRVHSLVKRGEKYFETEWRKFPKYQGGFVLDGGVHFLAALRLMLGDEDAPTRVSAFSAQNQQHLPPVDTVNAIIQTKTGISGTFSVSFGTTFEGSEYAIAREKGTISVSVPQRSVEIIKDGKKEIVLSKSKDLGVTEELEAWADSIKTGYLDSFLAPAEALADLKILEAILRSGEQSGVAMSLV